MDKAQRVQYYSPVEEKWNIGTHFMGVVLSVIFTILLLTREGTLTNTRYLVSFLLFGGGLTLLYLASTLYHSSKSLDVRYRLNIVDHISIYMLIAGTYSPFALITLEGQTGNLVFGLAWGIAIFGTFLKLFYTGRFQVLSTLAYIGMGWLIVFFIVPLVNSLPHGGLIWTLIGGLSYTVGAGFYLASSVRYNHAIFHLFVLGGSICHFIAVYMYVY